MSVGNCFSLFSSLLWLFFVEGSVVVVVVGEVGRCNNRWCGCGGMEKCGVYMYCVGRYDSLYVQVAKVLLRDDFP